MNGHQLFATDIGRNLERTHTCPGHYLLTPRETHTAEDLSPIGQIRKIYQKKKKKKKLPVEGSD